VNRKDTAQEFPEFEGFTFLKWPFERGFCSQFKYNGYKQHTLWFI